MFTGLIEAVGEVVRLEPTVAGCRLRIASDLCSEIAVGDSVGVNGVCLTAIRVADGTVEADLGPETARLTTLGRLRAGMPVNLERPLRADGRLGGHFVQGHVDGIGAVEHVRPDGECQWLTISFPVALAPYLVAKGSIAVDGISLTIAALRNDCFDVQIIPHTWRQTNLKSIRVHDAVNLECDLVGKYVVRALEVMETAGKRS